MPEPILTRERKRTRNGLGFVPLGLVELSGMTASMTSELLPASVDVVVPSFLAERGTWRWRALSGPGGAMSTTTSKPGEGEGSS